MAPCTTCAEGSYSNGFASTSCTSCPTGFITPSSGSLFSTQCFRVNAHCHPSPPSGVTSLFGVGNNTFGHISPTSATFSNPVLLSDFLSNISVASVSISSSHSLIVLGAPPQCHLTVQPTALPSPLAPLLLEALVEVSTWMQPSFARCPLSMCPAVLPALLSPLVLSVALPSFSHLMNQPTAP